MQLGDYVAKWVRLETLTCLSVLFCGCEAPCSNHIMEQNTSPDGRHKIVLFSRECGATVQYNLQASILDVSDVLRNETGNALIVEGDVNARWNENGAAIFEISKRATVYKKLSAVNGVRAIYVFNERL